MKSDNREAAYPLLTDVESHQLLVEWNDTSTDYPQDLCLHELFEAQVNLTPDNIAVVFGDQRLTYRELNQRANQLAHYIRALGVGPEVLVGIFMSRSLEMVIGLYGILKAGGAYVPLDPEYPKELVAFMLEDTQVPVVLTQTDLVEKLPSHVKKVVCLDAAWQIISKESAEKPVSGVMAENLAYVIYTSGSTGKPKGVMICHMGICNRLLWMQDAFRLTDEDLVLQKTPFSFDVSVWEFFWPLMSGARLVVAQPGGHKDSTYLIKLIKEQEITTLHFVPSMLQVFLTERGVGDCKSIKRVISSGEVLTYELQERFFTTLNAELHNLYGPTEAAVDVTYWACQRESNQRIVPIGRPIANTQIYLLDKHMHPVPIGVAGELHIGGVQVARGYLNRPELTVEKFIAGPFNEKPGARLYKTGDIARYLPDGNIEYLGRMDYQVKIRGFRIELEEIESVLTAYPAVEKAAVIARDYKTGDRRLVAYLVPDKKRAFTLRKQLHFQKRDESEGWRPYELPNGLIISHLNPNETEFSYREIFEEKSYLKHGITLEDGACVFDVGANIGLFSLFVAGSVRDATVYAFEPIPPVFDVLAINASFYDFKIIPIQRGLSNEARSATFTYYPYVSIISGRFADPVHDRELIKSYLVNQQLTGETNRNLSHALVEDLLSERLKSEQFRCEMTTISDVIREYDIDRLDLLKIDVEKSEHEVLAGIHDDDWDKIRQIVVEVHDIDGRLDKLTQLLTEQGYQLAVEQDSLFKKFGLYILYAWRLSAPQQRRIQVSSEPTLQFRPAGIQPSKLIDDVRKFVHEKLPEYMMPSAFILLEDLPLTPSGKLDRRALPAPDQSRPNLEQANVAPHTKLEHRLAKMWCEILMLERVGIHDKFFELGGDSIKAALFINRLQKELNEFIYIVTIFEAPTIAEFATFLQRDYAEAVVKWLGTGRHSGHEGDTARTSSRHATKVNISMVEQMRKFIPSLPPSEKSDCSEDTKNPPAIFILAPPRSGTTLLRVMLAGHPHLLAAPELQLLCFNTLKERKAAFTNKFSAWLEGTIRTIMEIKGCNADEAKRIMRWYESKEYTTKSFYRVLQEWIGDRILIDKTPSYALDLETLKKAERDFENALYIHLIRHPYSTIGSFESMHMDQVLFLYDHPFTRRELGELVWTISHQNILGFLKFIPENRQFCIAFEDLTSKTREVMETMCQRLRLEFHIDMLCPYKDKESKMTDGIYPESIPMGDIRFHEYREIKPEIADTWKRVNIDNFLGDVTWEVAEALGYINPSNKRESDSSGSDGTSKRMAFSSSRKLLQKQRRRRQLHRKSKELKKENEEQ